jgi:hypothetical protein
MRDYDDDLSSLILCTLFYFLELYIKCNHPRD